MPTPRCRLPAEQARAFALIALTELQTRLCQRSPEFVKRWDAPEIRSTASGRKTMNHPTKGSAPVRAHELSGQ
ncbi:hypothetical protein [Bradyrhizobium sp. Cp5.3]|uniref:MmyB family transcriptional regulator n=1 Tax=Bradyrhizobium sp. Cp5.3 TaxID=443598 RepID=UPI0004225B14|nr:hypothetical protein [Bradyrhizobium sp. Cp5.3]